MPKRPAKKKKVDATETRISSILHESRTFAPPREFARNAHIGTAAALARIVDDAAKDPVAYWVREAKRLSWIAPWTKPFVWKYPHAKWFVGGKINASVNCLDRHLVAWRKTKAAIIWEGEPGEIRTLTYQQLHSEVCRMANVLRQLGVKQGDVVGIYMGMIPEAAVAMLACARIGATHNVVFGGFSAEALRERLNDSLAVCVITQDVAFRRGERLALKIAVDDAISGCPTVNNVIVVQRGNGEVPMQKGRDHWWHDWRSAVPDTCTPARCSSEHPLFILYTSGSTGKPKGIVHTTGGYLTQVSTSMHMVFDLHEEDIYYCTADVGWITGHSYVVYGPLMHGATVLMYEGAPNWPEADRIWDIIQRHRVSILYTAPTSIRAFMKSGESWLKKHDLSSLRLLGTVGEPINPEAWMWYHQHVGGRRCPIVDTWWQTETGAIMIAPVPGVTSTKPGTATQALPGIDVGIVRKDGTPCKVNEGGYLVIKHPWPSMLRTIHGDDHRYRQAYWSDFPKARQHPGWYFTGDGARKDKDGYIWLIGRVDDVVNVSGHRLGTAEIESALVAHRSVAEAAVVTRPDDVKGNALVAFVTLKVGANKTDLAGLKEQLRQHVGKEIGNIAKPDDIRFTDALPKTRSGKIMRRLLRELVQGGSVMGDVTTLEDLTILERLRDGDDE